MKSITLWFMQARHVFVKQDYRCQKRSGTRPMFPQKPVIVLFKGLGRLDFTKRGNWHRFC